MRSGLGDCCISVPGSAPATPVLSNGGTVVRPLALFEQCVDRRSSHAHPAFQVVAGTVSNAGLVSKRLSGKSAQCIGPVSSARRKAAGTYASLFAAVGLRFA
jgi:hypothetical protein